MEASHSGQLHTLGKREPHGFVGSNPTASAILRQAQPDIDFMLSQTVREQLRRRKLCKLMILIPALNT